MPLMYRLNEDCPEETGLTRTRLNEDVKAGRLKIVKVGRRTLVRHEELIRYIDALEADYQRSRGSGQDASSTQEGTDAPLER